VVDVVEEAPDIKEKYTYLESPPMGILNVMNQREPRVVTLR
jgi:hypothetical protein